MNGQSFWLSPFPTVSEQPAATLPPVKITGNIVRHSHALAIDYALCGTLAELVIPEPAKPPSRKHDLWQTTCLEFFLAVPNSPQYWEFNLSTSGDWNVYRFAAYRQGMQEESAFTTVPFRIQHQPEMLKLDLELDLEQIIRADQPLEVAITAVIQPKTGELTYWALTHWTPQADFHQRDSFLIKL